MAKNLNYSSFYRLYGMLIQYGYVLICVCLIRDADTVLACAYLRMLNKVYAWMDSPIFVRLTNKQMCTLSKEAIHHACEPAVGVRFLIKGTPRMKQSYIFRLLSIYYLFLLGIFIIFIK
jgi:hypothetical protein